MDHFDCMACGACCCNSEERRATGSLEYIEINRRDRLLQHHRGFVADVAHRNDQGQWHMKLVGEEQRCISLKGELDTAVSCSIYALRPKVCRLVASGDEECLKARQRAGLPLCWPEEKIRLGKR